MSWEMEERPFNALNDHMRSLGEWTDLEVTESHTAPPEGIWKQYHVRQKIRYSEGFKSRKELWDATKLDYWQISGNRMAWIKECEPQSFEDWAQYYFTKIPWEEFKLIGKAWAKVAGISEREGIAECLCHLVDYAWEGAKGEIVTKALMEDYHNPKGQGVEYADGTWDYLYAIDLIVGDGEKMLFAIQVKSEYFFISPKIQWERDAVKAKHKAFTARYKVPVFFVNSKNSMDGILKYISADNVK